jgi:hypothetical protein
MLKRQPKKGVTDLDLQISQYTGALLIMFLFHTIELIHCERHPRPVQNMYKQVPVFRATLSFSERILQSMNSCTFTFKVPVEGNDTEHKANEREGTVQLVRREMPHRIPRVLLTRTDGDGSFLECQ